MTNWKLGLFLLFLFTSCTSPKNIVYLQDIKDYNTKNISQSYEAKIQYDDLLGITVNSKNLELTIPFTLPVISYQSSKSDPLAAIGTQQLQGLLVDSEGYINYPVLGKMKVVGLTRMDLISLIQNRIRQEGYIDDPIVTIKFLNFKISVMGEVARPGTFAITSDRVTLLEALSLAGDLTIFGKRDRVTVIRENNGQRFVHVLDLRSANLFDSPAYYLCQNDIVYVEPNKTKAGQSTINQNNSVGVWISLASFLTTIGVLIFK